MRKNTSRRGFLKAASAAVAVAASTGLDVQGASAVQGGPPQPDPAGGNGVPRGPVHGPPPDAFAVPNVPMPTRVLGRTGVHVSLMGLGGYHIGIPDEAAAVRAIHEAMDHGLTFLDNSWDYNGGESERRVGKALLGGYRERAFLMTKIDGRTAEAAAAQIDQSLRRLQTSHLDLLQIHEVVHPDDPQRVFAPGGAIEALVHAREQGKARFLGFTGHKSPGLHLAMLDAARSHGFRFDAVQMPLNVFDAQTGQDSFQGRVLPLLLREGIGVLGMKPLGSGILLTSGVVSAVECLRYAMSLPVAVTITGVDSLGVLRQDLHTVLTFEPMPEQERQGVLARARGAAASRKYEKYKTTTVFDSTTHHPRWLTSAEAG